MSHHRCSGVSGSMSVSATLYIDILMNFINTSSFQHSPSNIRFLSQCFNISV